MKPSSLPDEDRRERTIIEQSKDEKGGEESRSSVLQLVSRCLVG